LGAFRTWVMGGSWEEGKEEEEEKERKSINDAEQKFL
jgi:hypothetical protein